MLLWILFFIILFLDPELSEKFNTAMKKYLILFSGTLLLLFSGFYSLYGQEQQTSGERKTLEQQYEEYITGALRLQVKSDSLTRTANQKRRELAFYGSESERNVNESLILSLEEESKNLQNQADSLYSQARAIELRMMQGGQGQEGGSRPSSGGSGTPDSRNGSKAGLLSDKVNPVFLFLGEHNISSGLSPAEILAAGDLEQDYLKATELMEEVSDINDRIEQLGQILDARPRRRERRKIGKEIDELKEQSFDLKMEAMNIFERVNLLRYTAAANYLEDKRNQLSDSLVIKSGLEHEDIAKESFRQAAGLRETAVDLRSDKYLEGFILRAYTEELKAFSEMEKALDIYNSPQQARRTAERELPLDTDGRINPGLALTRSRSAATGTASSTGTDRTTGADSLAGTDRSINAPATEVSADAVPEVMDFGFSVNPVTEYSDENPVPGDFQLPQGMVYTIQLGIFNTLLQPESFGGLYPVMSQREPDSQSIRYMTGVFRSVSEAEKALFEVNRQGFTDAFIVAFNDGRKMPVNRARQIEGTGESEGTGNFPLTGGSPEVEKADPQGPVDFKVQLGVYREIVQPSVYRNWQNLAGNKNVEQLRNNNGLYVYSIGNFNTFEDAVAMQKNLRKQGISDAFVVPYKGGIRITMEEANELLQRR